MIITDMKRKYAPAPQRGLQRYIFNELKPGESYTLAKLATIPTEKVMNRYASKKSENRSNYDRIVFCIRGMVRSGRLIKMRRQGNDVYRIARMEEFTKQQLTLSRHDGARVWFPDNVVDMYAPQQDEVPERVEPTISVREMMPMAVFSVLGIVAGFALAVILGAGS